CVGAAVVGLLVGCSTDDEAAPADTPTEDVTAGDGATTGDGQVDGGEASDASVDDDGGPAPDALYTTCSGTLMCAMEACDDPVSGELSCLTPCLDGSSEDALGGFDVFFQCMAEQCFAGPCAADDAADDCVDVCMKSECAYELIACVDPGTFGDGDCVSGMDCIEECGGEDEAGGAEEYGCIGECFGELQDGAKGDLAGLLSCMGAAEASHEGEGVDPFDSCPTEALQCMTSGETGDEDCVGVVGCLDVCGAEDDGDEEGPGCMAACFASGTADAQSAATSLFECIDDADTEEEPPSEDQALACLQEACGTELFGCLADADCTDALGCLGECGEDEDCQLSCFAGLSEDTMTVLTALGECSDANGCLG
ncbi:MAG: hypothetical protein VX938_03140, partial [Myxococcota bacterium]|nr:hypothetical protein [Myxococcota bacterium]